MNTDNTEKLFASFPRLYRGRNKPIEESLMSFGFDCGDGWFRLIWNLSQAIEDVALCEGGDLEHENWPEAVQVKQKFGELRFYLRERSEAIESLTDSARNASLETCEVCGEPGSLSTNSRPHIQTLCQKHANEFSQQSSSTSRVPVWKLPKD